MRFGAVFLFRKTYGAVPCGFQEAKIVRCGAVNEMHRTDRKIRTVKDPLKKEIKRQIKNKEKIIVLPPRRGCGRYHRTIANETIPAHVFRSKTEN